MVEIISVPDSLKSASNVGRLVFPSWSNVSQTKLLAAWTDAGIGDKLAPSSATELAILKTALGSVSSMRRLIRPLPNRRGYGIVSEHATGERELGHRFELAVWVEGDGAGGRTLVIEPASHPLAATVRAAWAEADAYPRERLSSWFSQKIIPALAGVPVKPMGGVWWISPAGVPMLETIDGAIRTAGAGKIYAAPAVTDAGSLVESILDGIAAETAEAAKKADALMEDAEITSRGLRGGISRLSEFAARLQTWGETLDVPLTAMRSRIEEVQATLVLAEGRAVAAEEAERAAKKGKI